MIEIKQIHETTLKSNICEKILHKLPEWFGIEESIIEYVEDVKTTFFFAAYDQNQVIGFIALKAHNEFTAEILVMGVMKSCHRQRVGRQLIETCLQSCKEKGFEYLTVKTLAESHPDLGYRKTREFYLAMGFKPLEVFETLWDEANPCLFMVKEIR